MPSMMLVMALASRFGLTLPAGRIKPDSGESAGRSGTTLLEVECLPTTTEAAGYLRVSLRTEVLVVPTDGTRGAPIKVTSVAPAVARTIVTVRTSRPRVLAPHGIDAARSTPSRTLVLAGAAVTAELARRPRTVRDIRGAVIQSLFVRTRLSVDPALERRKPFGRTKLVDSVDTDLALLKVRVAARAPSRTGRRRSATRTARAIASARAARTGTTDAPQATRARRPSCSSRSA